MKWSVRNILDFSFTPALNEAYEGSWTNDDSTPVQPGELNASVGTDWMDDADRVVWTGDTGSRAL